MSMRIVLFLAVGMISLSLPAQNPEIKRERVFTGDGLYGFMNGGADLYLEYGCQSLVNRDLVYQGESFTVDIYEMPCWEDAYGIYSMHIFRCQQADTLESVNCFSPYQLQAVVDNFYVSIVFPSGSTKAQQLAGELIPLYVSPHRSFLPDIPKEIAPSPPFSGVVKYLRGTLSVSHASRDLTALLKNTVYRGVWFSADRTTQTYTAAILFSSSDEKEKLKQMIPESDILRSDEDALFIRRKEKEDESAKSGEFGF